MVTDGGGWMLTWAVVRAAGAVPDIDIFNLPQSPTEDGTAARRHVYFIFTEGLGYSSSSIAEV